MQPFFQLETRQNQQIKKLLVALYLVKGMFSIKVIVLPHKEYMALALSRGMRLELGRPSILARAVVCMVKYRDTYCIVFQVSRYVSYRVTPVSAPLQQAVLAIALNDLNIIKVKSQHPQEGAYPIGRPYLKGFSTNKDLKNFNIKL